ncbi:class I histocompatibility antigen, F10 alpha chain-like [Cyprinus carpio]|uniref:Class I histocompatibility antigen, F10 alpha chain-like n=1 Tax=Cyprinus carpio TaxID=7962 RepID=A0A9Q9VND3_CYPCA|nr:class I histocompatibility antigen, F10 alpha chain-like [Cyprinus carpio]
MLKSFSSALRRLHIKLDGQQIDYYDSEIKKLIPKQDWMKEFASGDRWKDYTEIRERVHVNISVIMQRFNQPRGVHTYQRMYGCEWDDETGDSRGFDEYSYDGERFISLDLKEIRYTEYVPQAEPTVMKWNNGKEQLDILKQYYDYECVYWLKELVHFSRATFKKTSIVPELTGQSLKEPILRKQV